jgi:hypothetical protein
MIDLNGVTDRVPLSGSANPDPAADQVEGRLFPGRTRGGGTPRGSVGKTGSGKGAASEGRLRRDAA